jgi:glycosyltransferase involved in cell wall biosynthesis
MTETLPSIEVSAARRLRFPAVTLSESTESGGDRPIVIRSGGAPGITIPRQPTIDVSVVVPYYNPGERLRRTVEDLVRVLDGCGLSYELITVSDGSTDGSPFTLAGFPDHVVRRVSYATNVGKGHALRVGLSMGQGRYLGFIDSDGDISPELLPSFLSIMEDEEPDMVVGSKRHRESSVHYTPVRRLYSRLHQGLVRLLFGLNVRDTQVGIKLVDRRVVADVLPLLREDRFALDLELLVLAQRLGYTRIVEAPVRIEERVGSTVSLKAARRLLADTLRVFVRTSVLHEYDTDPASQASGIDCSEGVSPVDVLEVTSLPGQIPA